MSNSKISRRDFIKMTTGVIGAAISIGLGLPVMSYLFSPALRDEPDETQISLGPLENYPIGVPTPFDFVRTKQNGWERTAITYGMFVLRKNENEVRVF